MTLGDAPEAGAPVREVPAGVGREDGRESVRVSGLLERGLGLDVHRTILRVERNEPVG